MPSSDDEMTFAARVKYELCSCNQSMFSIDEPNNRELDVEYCFAPPTRFTLIGRILTCGLSFSILIYDYSTSRISRGLYWGYLTMWTYVLALSYLVIATIVSVKRDPFLRQPSDTNVPHHLIKAMWALYAVAAPGQIIVILMYWLTVVPNEGISGLLTVFFHGILGVFVLVDGLLLSRIPLRRNQLLLTILYGCLFMIWTLLHAYTGLGDGIEDSGDDLLYGIVDWRRKPEMTAIILALVILVAFPVVFIVLCLLSLVKRPLYLSSDSRLDDALLNEDSL